MRRKKILLAVALVLIAGIAAAGVGLQHDAGEADELSLMTVTVRLDRQNDIYDQLAQRIEDCASADEPTVSDREFRAFCEGVNCLVRDEMLNGLFERAQIPADTAMLLRELMAGTAKYEMEELQPSELSVETLGELAECLYLLADCCDRGQEGTLAYCVSVQDFESEGYRAAETQVRLLMTELDGLLS